MALAPAPQLLHLGYDHAWLAWSPPERGIFESPASYRLHATSLDGGVQSAIVDSGTVGRIDGLSTNASYEFHVTADKYLSSSALGRTALTDNEPTPTMRELLDRQGRQQSSMLFTLDAVNVAAGPPLRKAYVNALREASDARRRAAAGDWDASPSDDVPCSHCSEWPTRPLFTQFSPQVDRQPEVSDADIAAVYRDYIQRHLRALGPITAKDLESSAQLHPREWHLRVQIIDNVPYVVTPTASTESLPIINHHHRKRLRGLKQILDLLLSTGPAMPDVDLVLNLGDAPRVVPKPQTTDADAPPNCAGFQYSELDHKAHGPFGPLTGSENLLTANGYQEDNSRLPPMFGATSCCFSSDLSFPTVWYDFESTDDEFKQLSEMAGSHKWGDRMDKAYFRGSIYWFERHGRTEAFARSLLHNADVDVDWYKQIDTSALEGDNLPIFGDLSTHAMHKYLLSLEGHSYWSFRLRQLMHLGSAILHQDLPCHEFWHTLLRPYEHYLPLQRNLSNLMTTLYYARAHEAEVKRMVERMGRLAARLLSRDAVLGYVREHLTQYAALLEKPVRRHANAQPLAEFSMM